MKRLTRRQQLSCLWASVPVLVLVSAQTLDYIDRGGAWKFLWVLTGASNAANMHIFSTLWRMHMGLDEDGEQS